MQPSDWQRQIYRASRLDEFRHYLSGEHFNGDEYTAADFIKHMTGFEESPAMAAGTAVHALIENCGFGELMEGASGGWHVKFELDAVLPMPAMREVALQRTHKGVTLFGRVDAMGANTIHDTKTTANVDVDRYLDSYQWRAYLWMSGRTNFVYDILKVKVEDDIKVVTVTEYLPLKVSAYPKMARDVESLLEAFDACVKSLGIDEMMRKAA